VGEGRNAWAAWSNVGGGLPAVIDSHSLSYTGWLRRAFTPEASPQPH